MQEHKHYYFLENLHKLSFYIKEHLPNGKVRTLTKIEMCRLQGFPDDYCDILTKNDSYDILLLLSQGRLILDKINPTI